MHTNQEIMNFLEGLKFLCEKDDDYLTNGEFNCSISSLSKEDAYKIGYNQAIDEIISHFKLFSYVNLSDFQETKPLQSNWQIWAGWRGNHDSRIEDAECKNCGFVAKQKYYSLSELPKECPSCHSVMNVKEI